MEMELVFDARTASGCTTCSPASVVKAAVVMSPSQYCFGPHEQLYMLLLLASSRPVSLVEGYGCDHKIKTADDDGHEHDLMLR